MFIFTPEKYRFTFKHFFMTENEWQSRTILQVGEERYEKLKQAHVLIAGLGGVGSYTAEMVCRAGVGTMTIIDGDVVNLTNCNRQLPALQSTIGQPKAHVMGDRLRDINPKLNLQIIDRCIKDEEMEDILKAETYNYVVDAIDTLAPKVFFIYHSLQLGLPLVSSMGAGGKYDPSQIRVADIADTYHCRLAHFVRKRLHKLGIRSGFKAVFSPEPVPDAVIQFIENEQNKKTTVGTLSYMTAIFGCYCASVVIRDLLDK